MFCAAETGRGEAGLIGGWSHRAPTDSWSGSRWFVDHCLRLDHTAWHVLDAPEGGLVSGHWTRSVRSKGMQTRDNLPYNGGTDA